VLDVIALVGEATVYVPSSMHVTLRTLALIGEVNAFGETRDGIFVTMNEEEFPAQGAAAASAPHLEIHVFMLIGEVTIKQVDAPVVTVSEVQPGALPQPQ
jgi:predicted membrane protein